MSPDGNFMWTGAEWIPTPPSTPSQTANVTLQDSVIGSNVPLPQNNVLETRAPTVTSLNHTETAEKYQSNSVIPTIKYLGTEFTQSYYYTIWSISMLVCALLVDFFDGIIETIILVVCVYEVIEFFIIWIVFNMKNKAVNYSIPIKITIITLLLMSLTLYLWLISDFFADLENTAQYGIDGPLRYGISVWLIGLIYVILLILQPIGLYLRHNRKAFEGLAEGFGAVFRVIAGMVQLSQGQMPQSNSGTRSQRVIQPCQKCNSKMKTLYRFNKCGRILCNKCSNGFTCSHCIAGCTAVMIN
jgi:hypothetical protein